MTSDKIAQKIIREGELGLLGKIGQVVVPIEKTMIIKSGKRISYYLKHYMRRNYQ